jgi:ornithine cyclodeaminase
MRDALDGPVDRSGARPLVFKSVGMSWEDLVIASAVLDAAPVER